MSDRRGYSFKQERLEKKEKRTKPKNDRFSGTSYLVLLYGLLVAGSLVLQAFIPFLQKMAETSKWVGPVWFSLVNTKFVVPIKLITDFWAWISAAYVGVDRMAFSVQAFKDANKPGEVDYGQKNHILQIIALSLFVYTVAVMLNFFLEADFALESLFASVGCSVLLYVSGNKIIKATDKAGEDEEKLDEAIEKDERTRKIEEALEKVKDGERAVVAIETTANKYRVIAEL